MTHRNADQRIREAFDALRAEIEAVFPDAKGADAPALLVEFSHKMQEHLHDFAKIPADA